MALSTERQVAAVAAAAALAALTFIKLRRKKAVLVNSPSTAGILRACAPASAGSCNAAREVICADAAEFKAPAFDRILLDAPCTGTGVIRRHPDIRLARDPDSIRDTVQLQREILSHCWSLLKPGGQLLYATCSVLPEENHKQIQGFLDDTPDASLETLTATGSIPVPAGLQLLPGLGEGDGFYYASLIKSASSQGVTA